ncbi:MAG: YggS family pyridoxal phosphate-dependent enzyme [Burkholderiales bacterium PBB3]|nr:MAG: YggS family pyridoxal phosphate-dependent enzyme [Burkholderiales bacterium PBB3]
MTMIAENLQRLHTRIAQACLDAGRPTGSVALLAVSKTFGADAVVQAHAAGQTAFGENYIQEAVGKITELAHLPLEWHCIGPIQSNKTRLVAEHFQWAHTIDRLKVAQRLSEQRPAHLPPLQVCIQVNMDGGTTKSGVPPQDALALAQAVAALPRLKLRGLMCIPEPAPDFIAALALFTGAKALFTRICEGGVPLDTLSMGMSADLEAAVQGGSTLVRVGSAIFGARSYAPEVTSQVPESA